MSAQNKRTKRGSSGLSFICGVKKPCGMTSHDVVNRVRRIFGEKRVGHAGTLDPAASGVMLVCAGPATRLSNYLVAHDKKYIARISFGISTDTEDAQGHITRTLPVPDCVSNEHFAQDYLNGLIGSQMQMPPVYSALKVGGKKSCDEARRGRVIKLEPREIEVYGAKLLGIGLEREHIENAGGEDNSAACERARVETAGDEGNSAGFEQTESCEPARIDNSPSEPTPYWDVEFHVSSGTYIRSLARDIGLGVGSVAHLSALERTSIGTLALADCATLEALEREGITASIDPVKLLGYRVIFLREGEAESSGVNNGAQLPACIQLYDVNASETGEAACFCTSGVTISCAAPQDGEKISVVADNKLKAIYVFDAVKGAFKAECVFSVGVLRGAGV